MSPLSNRPNLRRWGLPAGVAVVVAGGIAVGPIVASAGTDPALPSRTAAQLLAQLDLNARGGKLPAFTGTVVETASLGLPSLPSGGGGAPGSTSSSPLSLLSGSNTVKVWYADPQHVRLSIPGSASETDFIRNGNTTWTWDSATNTYTKSTHTPDAKGAPKAPDATATPRTPQDVADAVLKAVGPSTTVGLAQDVTVAGQSAYQLVIAPKSSQSLIGSVRIAIDGKNYLPLRVQVMPKSATSPALQVGFTSVDFTQPAPANFAFSPPADAREGSKEAKPDRPGNAPDGTTYGHDWLTVGEVNLPGGKLPTAKGDSGAVVNALLRSATPVSGSWGSGKLLKTALVSFLLTDDGHLFFGAVAPAQLYAAAAKAK